MTERKIEVSNSDRKSKETLAPVEQAEKSGSQQPGHNPSRRISADHAAAAKDPEGNAEGTNLNNANPEPPEVSKEKLRQNAEDSHKLDSPARTNDSTVDPNKPEDEILRGFHGG